VIQCFHLNNNNFHKFHFFHQLIITSSVQLVHNNVDPKLFKQLQGFNFGGPSILNDSFIKLWVPYTFLITFDCI